MLKKAALAVTGSGILAGAYVTNYGDEGQQRSIQFWKSMFPVFMHYRVVQLLNRDLQILDDSIADPYYEKLHEKYSPKIENRE